MHDAPPSPINLPAFLIASFVVKYVPNGISDIKYARFNPRDTDCV